MKFLIQKNINLDFIFTLKESIVYHNWLNNDDKYITYLEIEFNQITNVGDNFIPVGTVEFVTKYINYYFNKTVKPINIPDTLNKFDFTKRYVFNGTEKDIKSKLFVKSRDKIKGLTGIMETAPKGNYQISSLIDIESEWRCFVHKNTLVGLNNYSGLFTKFPNVDQINKMIRTYENKAPVAYTLDVAITEKTNDTVIIEVHDFFSCGLYGFNNLKLYPFMLSQWYYNYINK